MASNEVMAAPEMPDWLKGQQGNQSDVDALTGLNNKQPRISLKGRKFRLIIEGDEIRKPADTLEAVILGVEPEKGKMVKTYYEKGYSSGDTEPPTCSSENGVHPDHWIANPKNPTCNTCPMNQFGSAKSQKGKPAKACKDSKVLYVAIPEDNEELRLGVDRTVFKLGVPVTSLNNLGEYSKFIMKNGYPLAGIVTKLEMEDSEFPVLQFGFSRFLEQGPGMIALQRNIEKDWKINTSSGPALTNEAKSSNLISQTSVVDVEEVNQKVSQASNESKGSGDVNQVIGDWENQ